MQLRKLYRTIESIAAKSFDKEEDLLRNVLQEIVHNDEIHIKGGRTWRFDAKTGSYELLHQIGEGYGPLAGEVTHRTSGVLVADRSGTSNAYALFNLQDRSELFIGSGVEVYEGMIVGENSRSGDMDVNPTKEKKLTNIRTHAHDEALRLTPPRPLTLESAIEFIAGDELVEVTPRSIRLRKRLLSQHDRRRERGREEDLRRAAERA